MADDACHRAIAERIDEAHGVPDHVDVAEGIAIGVIVVVPAGGTAVTALIRRDHVIAGGCERQYHLAPAIGELRETVQQQQQWASCGLETRLQHVHLEAIVVVDVTGADAGGQCVIAIRRKTGGQLNDHLLDPVDMEVSRVLIRYSPLMLAALMIGHHRSTSARCNAPSASGVSMSRGGSSAPRSVSRFAT